MIGPAAALVAGLAAGAAVGGEPSMFRADPRHTGAYNVTGVPVLHGVKWQFRTGGPVLSSPVESQGTVYVGSADHYLYALDAATGSLKWKFGTQGRISSSPAVADGRVYFGSYDSQLYAVDAMSGQLLWKFSTSGERRYAATHLHGAEPAGERMPDPFDTFLSSPVVWNQTVYFGSGDHAVYAVNDALGTLRWKFQTGDVVHASPAVADGVLYVGSWDGNFYALDAADGHQRWRFKGGTDPVIHNLVGFQSSAAIADGTVYVGCRDAHLYALDAGTGVPRWTLDTQGSWIVGSPAVRNAHVYAATSDSGLFQDIEAATGKPVFHWESRHWPMFSSPALAGHIAYIGTLEGKLVAIDLTTRAPAWEFQTDGSRRNGAALTKPNGAPDYEAAYADFFYDDLMAGFARMTSVGAIFSSPLPTADAVVFGSADGNVYALD